jgi:hypothetical protein
VPTDPWQASWAAPATARRHSARPGKNPRLTPRRSRRCSPSRRACRRWLLPALEGAVPGLDGRVAADALIGAFAVHYDCDQPGNAAVMARITSRGGNVLENLATLGAVPPAGVLPVGLAVLSVLAELCRSDSDSVLQRAA